jgi:large subunit ribosomal protein L15
LQSWIDNKRLDPTQPITPGELVRSGAVNCKAKDGIKLLGRGGQTVLKTPINIMVSRASTSAIEAVEAAGGKIVTRYYTNAAIKRLAAGESINTGSPLPFGKEHVEGVLGEARAAGEHRYRLPDPTSRADIEYYRDPAHRGYLSHTLQPGESPSLYFKVPGEKKVVYVRKASKEAEVEDERLF